MKAAGVDRESQRALLVGLCASLVYEGSGGLVLGSLHGLAISAADALDELTQAF